MTKTTLKHYSGLKEVQQITHNSVRAKGKLRIYEMVYASLNELFTPEEATALRKQFVANRVQVYELTNAAYKDKIEDVPGFDELTEVRYIDPKQIHYQAETIIYDDVVAFYTYGDDAYGVEIIDKAFAETQKQIFDQLWRKASRPVIGRGGRSSLI